MKARHQTILQALGYLPETESKPVEADRPKAAAKDDDGLADVRRQAARANGLPEPLADRLQGGSPAEIQLDAQRLARSLEPDPTNAGELAAMGAYAVRSKRQTESLMPPQSWSEKEARKESKP
jgi:hypothetical protein